MGLKRVKVNMSTIIRNISLKASFNQINPKGKALLPIKMGLDLLGLLMDSPNERGIYNF